MIVPTEFVPTTLAIFVAATCCGLLLLQRAQFSAATAELRKSLDKAQGQNRFLEATLSFSSEAIVVLETNMLAPVSYRGGGMLLKTCLSGPDSAFFARHLNELLKDGVAFDFTTEIHGKHIHVRGQPVGRRAVLFFRENSNDSATPDFRGVLETLPLPVWIRGRDLKLRWANPAYLAAAGASTLKQAQLGKQSSWEIDLARAASDGGEPTSTKRYVVISGKRRALSVELKRLPDACVAGSAIDVTEMVQSESRQQFSTDAHTDMLDRMPIAVAVFNADQKLTQYNPAFTKLWNFAEDWLNAHPSAGEILDALRTAGRLPEQRDYNSWKRKQLNAFSGNLPMHNFWPLPDGKALRITVQPHLLGGAFFLFEDVSERLRLESMVNSMKLAQRATLDTIDDGLAVFGPDGRLKTHNSTFARIFNLDERDLRDAPHISKISALARTGQDDLWQTVSAAVTSDAPERIADKGQISRAAERLVSLALSRLPDGTTLAAFKDITDIERFLQENELAYRAISR